jgi:hypothetical protein
MCPGNSNFTHVVDSSSYVYALWHSQEPTTFGTQPGWNFCQLGRDLFYGHGTRTGVCAVATFENPAGAPHVPASNSYPYYVRLYN